jgi:hypothetical protein
MRFRDFTELCRHQTRGVFRTDIDLSPNHDFFHFLVHNLSFGRPSPEVSYLDLGIKEPLISLCAEISKHLLHIMHFIKVYYSFTIQIAS